MCKRIQLLLVFSFVLFLLGNLNAQVKKADVMAEPVGGIKAIMNNVVYPEQAKNDNIEGKVFVKAVIDKDGNVSDASILKSANKYLDQAALDAVKKTKFTPGMDKGKKVAVEMVIPIMFKLH